MEIENTRKTIKINQMRYITVIAFIVLMVVILTTDLIQNTFLGLSKAYWAIVVALLFLGQNLFEYLKDYNYLYYNDEENNKILFRYISLLPFKNKRYSIEIQKEQFKGYKILRPNPFKQEIVFYVSTPQGTAKYPPISISALNEDEFNKLKKALNNHIH
jgi:hypothetical protein